MSIHAAPDHGRTAEMQGSEIKNSHAYVHWSRPANVCVVPVRYTNSEIQRSDEKGQMKESTWVCAMVLSCANICSTFLLEEIQLEGKMMQYAQVSECVLSRANVAVLLCFNGIRH